MYGWRANIGLITPVFGSMECAFHRCVPEGVGICSVKFSLPAQPRKDLGGLAERIRAAAELFRDYRPNLIVVGYAGHETLAGKPFDKICKTIVREACKTNALTVGEAELEALGALGARRIAVVTAESEEENKRERNYFVSRGFQVSSIASMDMEQFGHRRSGYELASEHFLYQSCRCLKQNGADVLLLKGVELDTMNIIPLLENDLELPVVTDHQAVLWSALRRCGIAGNIPQGGRLFSL